MDSWISLERGNRVNNVGELGKDRDKRWELGEGKTEEESTEEDNGSWEATLGKVET